MDFIFNPFELDISIGSNPPIKSITVSSNIDWFSVPANALTGSSVVLPVNVRNDIAAYKVFATGTATGSPSMISLQASHIPNIAISQVTGLQSALNSILKSLGSANPYLTVGNNGVGDYTLTVNVGTVANTVAAGNDTRFPASVTGLRKSSGAGSTDVAAVAKTDYWDTTVFGASGASHAKGLVPDPGGVSGTTKFLREDGSWIVPAGTGTVTSVALTLPAEFTVTGSPVTTNGTLAVSKANQTANTVYAGPATGSPAAPTFRSHVFADISGLIGTTSTTIAVGNDTRFPANVTGIRKGAGVGSSDIAAVAKTDYWDTTVFGSKGPGHSIGLVPDPGAGAAPYTRYLREDGTWQVFIPDAGTVLNSQLATMSAKTLKANATTGTASPTDVDAKTARSSSLLNLESITTFGDTNYTAVATDKRVSTSANLTTSRTVTLPLANTFNPGQTIEIFDDFGGINGLNVLVISRQGSDTIQGSSSSLVMDAPFGGYSLASNGSNKWMVVRRTPPVRLISYQANGTYTTSVGVKAIRVQGWGAGGGGGGAVASASNMALGSGGGGGGYGEVIINNPASSYVVTIGTGGSGGANTGTNGTDGGNTSFGAALICNGGAKGIGDPTGGNTLFIGPAGGSGGIASSIPYFSGGDGGSSTRLSGTVGRSGYGGSSGAGQGSVAGRFTAGTSSATSYGGGGAGACSSSASGFAGGNGANGLIIITEYY